ncbi:diguanylate cyclase/phosphodiesterase (GGDEF & EAL domains) with PAS/PAC sensor(s) [hydrothermal vent metagenome]|uniref:Diguanylate cyclase/phosphodiesterase (GGDEF & EAL domains) with PAS/PAC sensor(S) n=1 Tax=hydrothermal vent metagenome TaxID=652676 RepID=A0A3B0Z3W5_9ZZZZ
MNLTPEKNTKITRHGNFIARRLVFYTVIASTLISICTSAYQLYYSYRTEVNTIESRLNEIQDSYSANIASRVWVSNMTELNITLRGITRLPDIDYIAIYEDGTLLSQHGNMSNTDTIQRRFPLFHVFHKKLKKIGHVRVVASLKNTYQHIYNQAFNIIVSNTIKTFLVSGFMLFLFYQLVAKHLRTIGKFTQSLNVDSLDNKIKLKRRLHPNKIDELDSLTHTLTDLQRRLKNSIFELTDSQEKVELLLDSTAEAIYGIDVNGCCTFANKACLEMLGYNDDSELLNKNMHQLIHHTYADGTIYPVEKCHIFNAFRNNRRSHIVNEVLWRKNATSFPAEYWSHPIFKDKLCTGAVVTFLDISQRIKFESKLKESEKNLAITLNSIGDAVIATDSVGNITHMNPVAEQLTGWTFSEACQQPLKDVFIIIDANTRETIENPIDKVLSQGEVIHLSNHTTLISKNGSEFQIADSAAPISDNGTILGMVLVFNDVTKQYQLRELAAKNKRDLDAIMNHTPAVIFVKSIKGAYLFVNRQFETLFNLTQQQIVGKKDYEIFDKEAATRYQANDQIVLSAGHSMEFEETITQDDGPHVYTTINFPLLNENNEVYAICGIATDITLRKHQEAQLRQVQKMDALGKLTSGIAHDYNNILAIILGYAEQIEMNKNNAEIVKKHSLQVAHTAKRGAKLANKLMAFSQHKQTVSTTVNINQLIQEQQHMLHKTLTVRIKLLLNLSDDLWPVEVDSSDFEDAIINICINALHAMPQGGSLVISTSNETFTHESAESAGLIPGHYVTLSISDTGCGMDDNIRSKIFDPFFSTKGELGNGLGLSQVHGFVERSGGLIKVFSKPNYGSSFTLYFPKSESTYVDHTKLSANKKQSLNGNETLLIVDDEPDMLVLANEIFTSQGYHVLTASDGIQALAMLERHKVKLIVSDVIMPNMDGYQLAAKVRQRYPEILIQMTSGFSDERHSDSKTPKLHQDLIRKPYDKNILLTKVRELLDKKTNINILEDQTVLVMDDDTSMLDLFKINLEQFHCKVTTCTNGESAINRYKQAYASDKPFDVVILDLYIPNGIGGQEIAQSIRQVDSTAKIIVASGNTEGDEMKAPHEFGFDASLTKDFNPAHIKTILEQVLISQ